MKRKKLDRSEEQVTVLAYVILTFFCILVILPCMNVIGEAISPGDDVLGGKVYFWPTGFQTDCINYILEHTRFLNSLKNTLVVTVLGTIVSIIVTVTTAYPLSKPEFKGRGWITFLYVFSMIFYGGMIPAYMVVKSLGLIDTYWGMILPFAIVQFDMFIVKSYFEGLPAEIIESAEVDGAGEDRVVHTHGRGPALAGQGGGVQGGAALHDDAVDGHPLPGLNHDDGAHLHLVRVHLLQGAVVGFPVGIVRPDVHKGTDAAAALAHGHALKELADLVQKHDRHALPVFAERDGAHRGHGHKEALVEYLFVLHPQGGLAQDVIAHGQIRHQEQGKQDPSGQPDVHDALADKIHRDEQNSGDDDAQ